MRYAGFLASGYRTEDVNSADNETALYVYDMTGKEAGTKILVLMFLLLKPASS